MDKQKLTKTILIVIEVGILCAVIAMGFLIDASNKIKDNLGNIQSEQQQTGMSTEDSETETLPSTENIGTEETQTEETISTEDITTEIVGTENVGTENVSTEEMTTETRIMFSTLVEAKMLTMTTEEKVAQLFLIPPESITGVRAVTSAGNTTKRAIEKYPVGGFVYEKKNFLGATQATTMIKKVQEFANGRIGLPLFIIVKEDATNYTHHANLILTSYEGGTLAVEIGETPAIPEGIQTCTASDVTEIITAINGGMDMIYAPSNFTQIYGAVLEAVNDGTISTVRLENAVGKVLTEKME